MYCTRLSLFLIIVYVLMGMLIYTQLCLYVYEINDVARAFCINKKSILCYRICPDDSYKVI